MDLGEPLAYEALEPGTPVYTADLTLQAARQALARATPDQTAEWRGQPPAEITRR